MPQDHPPETSGSLLALAQARFRRQESPRLPPEFTYAERTLLEKAPKGEMAFCGPPDLNDRANDPSKAETRAGNPGWGRKREVDAQLIRWICVDRGARERIDPAGLQIAGAKITGALDLSFVNVPWPIVLMHCAFTRDAYLQEVELPMLALDGCWTKAISADGAIVKGDVFLRNGFHAEGEVRLLGAQIGDSLECGGGTFENSEGYALYADHAEVNGYILLRFNFKACGEVNLRGTKIGANLECDGGTFINIHGQGKALDADGLIVRGDVFLRSGFHSLGLVRLLGAQIGGDLDCSGGTFSNSNGSALSADGADVKGYVYLCDRIVAQGGLYLHRNFIARGGVGLPGVQIGRNLDCSGGSFDNWGGAALDAEGVIVQESVFLSEGFNARGFVSLANAKTDGDLNCDQGKFQEATLDLTDASVGGIRDENARWPKKGKLLLDGFVYGRIVEGTKLARPRLDWLALQPDKPFATQPYLQLAKVLREGGDDEGAERVMMAMEDRRREGEIFRPVLKWTIGYGQHPLWAGWWAASLGGLGWILYRRSYLAGGMVPTEKDACRNFKYDGRAPQGYTAFSPIVYLVENSLPLVKLGQADKWAPDPGPKASPSQAGRWIQSAGREKRWPGPLRWLERGLVYSGLLAPVDLNQPPSRFSRWGTSPRFLRWFVWIQILLGWLLATLFLAGISGIVRKD
jgi:hypothetical protein